MTSRFDDATRLPPLGDRPGSAGTASFTGQVRPAWNIGANPNRRCLLALALVRLRERPA